MNKKLIFALGLAVVVIACNKEKSTVEPVQQNQPAKSSTTHLAGRTTDDSGSFAGSLFIPTDVANQMINSYIYSLNQAPAGNATPDLKSFSIDADSFRAYLANPDIKNIKVIFAHTTDYINSGHAGQYAGLQSGAITIIVAGYNAAGDYIYYHGNNVLDHAMPCPYSCAVGAAGSDLLQ